LSWCVKVDTLGRLCYDDLERLYNHFTTTNIYFIGAVYNSYFLIIYKPLSLIISSQTFSTQLEAGTAWFCLSKCAIPFCTLSTLGSNHLLQVIGVGFQLYGQLKKSPHDDMGVLGSTAVSTVNQATRLGKGSSVTARDKCMS